MIKDMLEEEES